MADIKSNKEKILQFKSEMVDMGVKRTVKVMKFSDDKQLDQAVYFSCYDVSALVPAFHLQMASKHFLTWCPRTTLSIAKTFSESELAIVVSSSCRNAT